MIGVPVPTPADPSRAHSAALHHMLTHRVPYPVHLGEVKTEDAQLELPYLVVWPGRADPVTAAMNGWAGEAQTTTQVTAVGRDADECLAAMDRAVRALHRQRATLTGRITGLVTHVSGSGPPVPLRDDRVRIQSRPVYSTAALFRLVSSPDNRPEE